jgi:hypothetical protein
MPSLMTSVTGTGVSSSWLPNGGRRSASAKAPLAALRASKAPDPPAVVADIVAPSTGTEPRATTPRTSVDPAANE